MANANLLSTATITKVLDTRIWAGVSDSDTSWLQSPIGSNSATGTISMAMVELTIDDGDAPSAYDLTVSTNPVTGTELLAILSVNSTTGASSDIPAAGNISDGTTIKWTGGGADAADTVYRLTFLYR
jgi:hypothetical protein